MVRLDQVGMSAAERAKRNVMDDPDFFLNMTPFLAVPLPDPWKPMPIGRSGALRLLAQVFIAKGGRG